MMTPGNGPTSGLAESEDLTHWQTLQVIGRAVRFVKPFRSRFAVKIVLIMISLIPLLMLPWPVKIIIDNVIEGQPINEPLRPYPEAIAPWMNALAGYSPYELLFIVIAFQAALFLLIGAFGTTGSERESTEGYLASGYDTASRTENEANSGFSLAGGLLGLFDFRWTMRLSQALNHHYRSQLFRRIETLPMPAFDDERIGDAVFRVMYDTPSITNASYRLLLTPITAPLHILMTVAIIGTLYGDHPELIYCALAFLPISFFATLPVAGSLRRMSGRSRKAGAAATSTAEEGMSNILAVQSLGGEANQRARYASDSWSSFSRYRDVFRLGLYAVLIGAIPGTLVGAYAYFVAIDAVIAGELSRGDFGLLTTYFFHIITSAQLLGGLWFSIQDSAAGLHRVFFLMDSPGEEDDPSLPSLTPIRQGLEIDKVDFTYPDGTAILKGIELRAEMGQMVALVGPAGAGKTTLAYLLPRFVGPTRGSVRVDGVDISEVNLSSLRDQMAFVFQETVLFDATVAENIRFGRGNATDEEVHEAARIAEADGFIRELPEGYDTPLGRGGGKLSVGQRQRLSLARALVRKAPILILDEPTSALDPETEARFVATLRSLNRDRIVIVIAHRLSTIRSADQIVFIENGEIRERGSHPELLAKPNGRYQDFVALQSGRED